MLLFGQFVLTRFFLAIVTLLTVSFIVFTLMEMVPANCAERYLSYKSFQGGQISEDDIAAEEHRLGLDKPYVIRWASWVGNVFFKGACGEITTRESRLKVYVVAANEELLIARETAAILDSGNP